MENKILINQRISISMLEMAMKAALDGTYNTDLALSLAAGEYEGQNRIKKCVTILNRLTVKNPLFPFIREHIKEYNEAIHFKLLSLTPPILSDMTQQLYSGSSSISKNKSTHKSLLVGCQQSTAVIALRQMGCIAFSPC